jgi:hypothetical protein
MGVYIKGMDKPKRCNICPLCRYYHENGNVWCNALNVILESIPYEMRLLDSVLDSIEPHKDCPLIEVKTPHGRLIDADVLIESVANAYGEGIFSAESLKGSLFGYTVMQAQTFVEAEVE